MIEKVIDKRIIDPKRGRILAGIKITQVMTQIYAIPVSCTTIIGAINLLIPRNLSTRQITVMIMKAIYQTIIKNNK